MDISTYVRVLSIPYFCRYVENFVRILWYANEVYESGE